MPIFPVVLLHDFAALPRFESRFGQVFCADQCDSRKYSASRNLNSAYALEVTLLLNLPCEKAQDNLLEYERPGMWKRTKTPSQ
jgi:hypothetical protein